MPCPRLLLPLLLLALPASAGAETGVFALPVAAHGDPASQLRAQMNARPMRVAARAATASSPGAGKLVGTVRLAGPAPEVPAQKRTKDRGVCGENGPDETLVLGEKNGVANAIVTLTAAATGAPLKPTAGTLDQKGCSYAPHVQALPLGSTLTLVNSDPVLHNVHGYLGETSAFNDAEPLQGQKKAETMKKAGLYRVRCDVHGWMTAWIFVSESPYFAVTDAQGAFHIDGLAPGSYTAEVWHERLAPQTLKVTIPASGNGKAEVKLSPKS
jgi:plastocyanin